MDIHLCHFAYIHAPHDFLNATLVVCYISSPTLSQFHNIDILLYRQDDHELTTCLIYAFHLCDLFLFHYESSFFHLLSSHAGL